MAKVRDITSDAYPTIVSGLATNKTILVLDVVKQWEQPTSNDVKPFNRSDVIYTRSDVKPHASSGVQEVREKWQRKLDFLMACIGFSVGLGNVWRFPYLCYKNGGGAFLIPFLVSVAITGFPLLFLEVSMGQMTSASGMHTWTICPLAEGIGLTAVLVDVALCVYYNVILAWALFYLCASFRSTLPWETCDNWWNTPFCSVAPPSHVCDNSSLPADHCTNHSLSATNGHRDNITDPVTEFWERRVLHLSKGLETVGEVRWDLCLCLLAVWLLVYFCLWKGVRSSGTVTYVTAPAPYIFLVILIIRVSLLPGSHTGIIYYLRPDFSRLADIQVWVDACTQVFYSFSIGIGTLNALGSYNQPRHNCYRDCLIFTFVDCGTSLLAGFLVFSVLGFMAHEQGVSISDVVNSGPGLAFIAYPKAVVQMPISPLWSILFFIMIIFLGIDSQFVGVEGIVAACSDMFPNLRRTRIRELFVAVVCLVMFLLGLCMVTEGGMYVFQLFDNYAASLPIIPIGFLEAAAVGWLYGTNKYFTQVENMLGFKINILAKLSIRILTPIYCLAMFVMSILNYSELTYETSWNTYVYPQWAVSVGWAFGCFAVIITPLFAVYKIVQYRVFLRKPWRSLVEPEMRLLLGLCASDESVGRNGTAAVTRMQCPHPSV